MYKILNQLKVLVYCYILWITNKNLSEGTLSFTFNFIRFWNVSSSNPTFLTEWLFCHPFTPEIPKWTFPIFELEESKWVFRDKWVKVWLIIPRYFISFPTDNFLVPWLVDKRLLSKQHQYHKHHMLP